MSTPASTIDQRVHQNIGDWTEVTLTTALTASVAVISTSLNEYDDANDDHYNGYWCYVTNFANSTKDRKIYDYTTTGGSCAVRGANFATDVANKATVRIYRYSYTSTIRAINDAMRELSDHLFRYIDDRSLILGNAIWDGHFEYWTSSSALTFWTASSAGTQLAVTAAASTRGALGSTSLKYTTASTTDWMYQSLTENPRLQGLQGKSVSGYVWTMPETAKDPTLVIYTSQAAGSATVQTLQSSTATAREANVWSLIEHDNQTLNDDLTTLEVRLYSKSSTKYSLWDNCRIIDSSIREYLLPEVFQDGDVCQVYIQVSGDADKYADDIMPKTWEPIYNWETFHNGSYKFIRIPMQGNGQQIRLVGTSPLTELTTFTGTTEVDGKYLDLLVAYSCYCLFRNEMGVASSQDTERLQERRDYWWAIAHELMRTNRMVAPPRFMRIG